MLLHLRVKDFALIEEAEVSFDPGLNILTGETGAGKSLLVDAMSLLFGGRASVDLVRKGKVEATIEALFDIAGCLPAQEFIEATGGTPSSELLVRRIISKQGRSRVYINGQLGTVTLLNQISRLLFEISGQNEHQSLSVRQVQQRLFDSIALKPEQLQQMAAVFAELKDVAERRSKTIVDEQDRQRRIDFLRFQVTEIESAGLRVGEEDELEERRKLLQNAGDLLATATEVEEHTYSADGSLLEQLTMLRRLLDEKARFDSTLSQFSRQLEEAGIIVEDVARGLGRYAQQLETDPEQLNELDRRLAVIHQLTRKHGRSVSELLDYATDLKEELDDLEQLDQRREELDTRLTDLQKKAADQATQLSAIRRRFANRFSRDVARCLKKLGMPSAGFTVAIQDSGARREGNAALTIDGKQVGPTGWDTVEYQFSANSGEDLKPIDRVASGGELSRLMLALRQVLGRAESVPTSIYDEVDTGISGSVADVVGRLLAEVSECRQVICVTHLPQISAYAAAHFTVDKEQRADRTISTVRRLSAEDRVDEIARLLAAKEVTAQARAHAKELIGAARPSS